MSKELRSGLKDLLLPRFDAACREMFAQVNSAFDSGLERVCSDISASSKAADMRALRLDEAR